ncbi:MAG: phosphate/phosphite/phosphonate ABC transporter substrate-binding protein [Pseudomonadota bacterium]
MHLTIDRRRHLASAVAVMALAAIVALPVEAAADVLTIGSVEEDVQAEKAIFVPLCDYLSEHLKEHGVDEVRLVVHTSINGIAGAFDRGELDLYLDSPVLTAVIARDANAAPFLRSWKEGVSAYSTIIYVRSDSDAATLDDLAGQRIAFKKRESTPGYFMPRAHFAAQSVPMVELRATDEPVPEDHVGYVFSHGDKTTLGWVMTGRVAAGVMKDADLEAPELRGIGDRIRVIAETPPMPRQVLTRRRDLDPALVTALRVVLTSMHETPEGRAVLQALDETRKFDEFPGGGRAVFERIWSMLEMVDAARDAGS